MIFNNIGLLQARAAASFATTAMSLAATLSCGNAVAQAGPEGFATGRILVMPRAGLPEAALGAILKGNGAGAARRIGQSDLRIVDLSPGQETATVERLKQNPHIQFAELDRVVKPAFTPNDPYFGNEWHLAKIGATTAWNITQGAGVIVAVLDTGVNGSHEDLYANMVAGWNIINNNSNTSDFMGHGTPVAGTIAEMSNNGADGAGVAGAAKIMPLVVTDSTGSSYYSVISSAITYAADHGARVANASFSGLPYSTAVQSAAQYMINKGGLVVVSAGNTGSVDNTTPTNTMVVVSATEPDDTLATWSTYGNFVSMSAPGDNIYSTYWTGGEGIFAGTSFAAPIVSGTIALIMSANPQLTSADVQKVLFSTAVDLGATGRDPRFGYGRVNAAAAVQLALTTAPTTSTSDTTPPTVSVSAPLAGSTVSGLVPVNVSASDNVGVTKVTLSVNGALYATSTNSPFGFSWDSTKLPNGSASLVAMAHDAAGNSASSSAVAFNVSNAVVSASTTPPTLTILSPTLSSLVGSSLTASSSATDNLGAGAITQKLYVDSTLATTASGATLTYKINTRHWQSGTHTLTFVASDTAGNATTATRQVIK